MTDNQKTYFHFLPAARELHFTADGLCWRKMEQAKAHAAQLGDPKIETFSRRQYEQAEGIAQDPGKE